MSEMVRIGEISQIMSGGTPSTANKIFWQGTIPWISSSDLKEDDTETINISRYITQDAVDSSATKIIPQNSVLVVSRVGVGKVAVNKRELCTSQDFLSLVFNSDKYNPQYLAFQVLNSLTRLLRLNQGTSIKGILKKDLQDLKVPLLSITEQTAISGFLSTWDVAIKKTERLIEAKENKYRWLVSELIYKGSEKNGWEKVRLGEICNPIMTKNTVGETNVLTSSAQYGLVSQMEYYNKSVSGADLSGYYLVRKGDYAYNRSSANGYPFGAIKRLDSCEQGVLSTLYLCFRIKDDEQINSNYLLHYFESGTLNRALRGICQAGARSHGLLNLSKGDFFGLKLKIPSIDRQKQIAEILDNAQQEIDLLKGQLELLKKQKRGLMQKLLTGQWRVKVPMEVT